MPEFTYLAHHPLQRTQLGVLTVRDPVWTEAVNAGSTLSFKVTVPEDPYKIARIQEATAPDESAIYVKSGPGRFAWGGIVKRRTWDGDTNTYSVTAVEWRSWLYQVILGPKTDLTGSNTYNWTNRDQLTIAQEIVGYLTAGGTAEGVPSITAGILVSGVNRNFTIFGTSFGTVGKYLDELSQQDRGFEWDVEIYTANDGLPALKFVPYFPERGGVVEGLLFRQGGNILSVDDVDESSEGRATRVWAVGEGPNAESLPYAVDQDPEVALGFSLRTDVATQYNGIYDRTTLAAYARSERAFRAQPLSSISFTVRLDSPDYHLYGKGDRCRVILKDRVTDIDVTGVRIIEREIRPQDGSGTAKLTVNMADIEAVEVDEGGAV